MNLVSIYSRRPGFWRHWKFLRNVPVDGRTVSSILRKEITNSPWVKNVILTPSNPGDMPPLFGSSKNPMVDQVGGSYCAIPFRPVEWWKEKANEMGGVFQHVLGLPVIVTREVHFIDNLLNV